MNASPTGIGMHRLLKAQCYILELIIVTKSGFNEAPPTKKPSMSFLAASSTQLPLFTDPDENEEIRE